MPQLLVENHTCDYQDIVDDGHGDDDDNDDTFDTEKQRGKPGAVDGIFCRDISHTRITNILNHHIFHHNQLQGDGVRNDQLLIFFPEFSLRYDCSLLIFFKEKHLIICFRYFFLLISSNFSEKNPKCLQQTYFLILL